ncbi:hypothetical protein GOBAR_DD30727 [Gossypium barbadense]|nr:hypothetical protein GOBAR_DD30727 [Gossypium barbadense]
MIIADDSRICKQFISLTRSQPVASGLNCGTALETIVPPELVKALSSKHEFDLQENFRHRSSLSLSLPLPLSLTPDLLLAHQPTPILNTRHQHSSTFFLCFDFGAIIEGIRKWRKLMELGKKMEAQKKSKVSKMDQFVSSTSIMSEMPTNSDGSSEQCKAGPDFFSFYAC